MVPGKKKKNRGPYPGLNPHVQPKSRWDAIDFDYIDKLSDKEKEYLSNFNEEYMSGHFAHKGKPVHKKKAHRKEAYGRNNARNRDIMSLFKTRGWVVNPKDVAAAFEPSDANPSRQEDVLIELLDIKNGVQEAELLQPDEKRSRNTKNRS